MILKTGILRSLPEDPMCLASRAQQGEQWQYQTRESLGQHPPSIGSCQIYMCCFHSQIFSPNYLSKTSEGTPWWVLLCTSSSLFHLDTCSLFSVHIPTQFFQLYETLKGKLADKGLRELPSGSRIVKISFHDKKRYRVSANSWVRQANCLCLVSKTTLGLRVSNSTSV